MYHLTSNPTSRTPFQKEVVKNLNAQIHNIHCGIIYNRKDWKVQMFINREPVKKTMVHIHTVEYYATVKKK